MVRYDVLVVGGGVNGCGIARDAAGRGHSVLLAEQGDLASATSSASTKLVHGGLRYLEYKEFRLVREALTEREVLLKAAPHIVRPLRFVLPHHEGLRPAWMLRLGLLVYDHLGGRRLLPPTRSVKLRDDVVGAPLREQYVRGFEYSDCWVDDSRLVVLNAIDAAERGAKIRVGTRVVSATREGDVWRVRLMNRASGASETVTARALVNATGPWTGLFQSEILGLPHPSPVRLVKGSHIVVKRLFEHDHAYIFQNTDGRILFAIPYEGEFTLIGTTDEDYDGDPSDPNITAAEGDYLCSVVSGYFRQPVTADDIVSTFAGVRPLYDDGASEATAASRDYVLELEGADGAAPVLNIVGGKITTYRRLAEAAMERLAPHLNAASGPWTAGASLPGGDLPVFGVGRLAEEIRSADPELTAATALRLARAYGTRALRLLEKPPGQDFGAGLTEREVAWLIEREYARTADDIIWRRSKLGLRMSAEQVSALRTWMKGRGASEHAAATG